MTITNDVKVKKVNHDTQESVGATPELCYAFVFHVPQTKEAIGLTGPLKEIPKG